MTARNSRPAAGASFALGRRALLGAAPLLLLTACGGGDPLAKNSPQSPAAGDEIVIGSQQYYSNEIIAELFAQVLEANGTKVKRQYQIGQREVYLPELKSGAIDLMPEYGGNLLQFLDPKETAKSPEEIQAALQKVLPEGIRALPFAEASDQDSFVVTKETAQQHSLSSLADVSRMGPVTIAANSELNKRPYGPSGLKEVYGIDATVQPVEDSGGPLTVKALLDGSVNLANIYSADPSIAENGFVVLQDPKLLVLPQRVTPLASQKVTAEQAEQVGRVISALDSASLIALNRDSVKSQAPSSEVASRWLKEKGLLK
ncbi:ABC transporter substrate-binding protein [Dermabacteraceae bacterium TAE3-ERU27]|nr:ABC transporter substrate-binding protein [Dermabacteraceae bacterium TAE3-ERU27]